MGLFPGMSISVSGLLAQRTRMRVAASNIAHIGTTADPGSPLYRRQVAVLAAKPQADFSAALAGRLQGGSGGVEVREVRQLNEVPLKRHQPGHPQADAAGYVSYPRISPILEQIEIMAASRAYQANLAAFEAARTMASRALDMGAR